METFRSLRKNKQKCMTYQFKENENEYVYECKYSKADNSQYYI